MWQYRTVALLVVAWMGLTGIVMAESPMLPLTGIWRFYNGAEFPGAKGSLEAEADSAVRLHYDFTSGGNYVGAYLDINPPAALSRVSLRLKTPAACPLTLRVTDSTGQDFQKPLDLDGTGMMAATDLCGWDAFWGGAKDGIVHVPLQTLAVLVEGVGLDPPTGTLEIVVLSGAGIGSEGAVAEGPREGRYVVTQFEPESGFVAGHGATFKGALLEAEFSGGTTEAGLSHSLSLFGRPKSLELHVKGGTPGVVVAVTLGSHFQSFSRTLGVLDGSAQVFSTTMPPDGWTHGGAEEESIAYPLRISAITLQSGDKPLEHASVVLDRIECVTVTPRAEAVTLLSTLTPAPGGAAGDMVAEVSGWNLLDESVEGTLTMTLRNWEDDTLSEASMPWTLPARGVRTRHAWPVTVPDTLNFADVTFSFSAQGVRTAAARAGFTRPLTDAGDAVLRPESPWGMGVYLYRYPADGKAMEQIAALAQTAGVKWTREEFSWAGIETAPGVYDFSFYDTVVDTARRHGVSVYGLLSYWGRFTQPYTEQGIDDFCRWARATVRHFKDRVKHWEIYNEPNIFFWTGPKELYPVLVKRCYAAIKDEDPDATVLAVSTSGIDRAFIKRVVDAGAPFDVLTVHPYRGRLTEAAFVRDLTGAQKLAGGRPVWITEMGWPTHIGGVDERSQAQLLARCYMAAVASGAVKNMGWYDFRNDGNDPFYNESNFGVLRQDMTPKPAYRALATVCRTMQKGKPEAVETSIAGVWGISMGGSVALWSAAGDITVQARFKHAPSNILNLMGEPLYSGRLGRHMPMTLRPGKPVFFVNVGGVSLKTTGSEKSNH